MCPCPSTSTCACTSMASRASRSSARSRPFTRRPRAASRRRSAGDRRTPSARPQRSRRHSSRRRRRRRRPGWVLDGGQVAQPAGDEGRFARVAWGSRSRKRPVTEPAAARITSCSTHRGPARRSAQTSPRPHLVENSSRGPPPAASHSRSGRPPTTATPPTRCCAWLTRPLRRSSSSAYAAAPRSTSAAQRILLHARRPCSWSSRADGDTARPGRPPDPAITDLAIPSPAVVPPTWRSECGS